MDKNMIHIDEIVRERLMGGEESPRSGSWLHMRELLDAKMPIYPPKSGFNWRRMYSVLVGLLLLTSASIGSYQFYRNNNSEAQANNNSVASKQIVVSNETWNNSQTQATTAMVVHPEKQKNEEVLASATPIAVHKEHFKISSKRAILSATETSLNKVETKTSNNPKADKNINNNQNQPSYTAKEAITQPKNIQNNTTPVINEPLLASSSNKDAIGESLKPKYNTDYNNNSKNLSNNTSHESPDNNKDFQPAPINPQLLKDTFRELQIVKRFIVNPVTLEKKLVADTISFGKIAIDRKALTKVNDVDETMVTAATIHFEKEMMNDLVLQKSGIGSHVVPLANFKIKEHKTSSWNSRSFNEVIHDVKFNLTQVKFYPGLMIGYSNYLLSQSNFNGFQFGITGLFTLDNWGLMGEVKYINRINTDFSYDDSYVQSAGNGLQQKVEHFFKFSTLQSVEIPVAMRYTMDRLNIFGGVNMSYLFGINPEEVQRTYAPEPVTQGSFATAPTARIVDFQNRFCLGGLLGISYDLTPSMQLDLRTTRNFWDDAPGAGGQRISQQLFKAPSFQISFHYRFSQQAKYPKAR